MRALAANVVACFVGDGTASAALLEALHAARGAALLLQGVERDNQAAPDTAVALASALETVVRAEPPLARSHLPALAHLVDLIPCAEAPVQLPLVAVLIATYPTLPPASLVELLDAGLVSLVCALYAGAAAASLQSAALRLLVLMLKQVHHLAPYLGPYLAPI